MTPGEIPQPRRNEAPAPLPAAPVLSVVRGSPSAEELAALVTTLIAVQSARAAADRQAAAPRRNRYCLVGQIPADASPAPAGPRRLAGQRGASSIGVIPMPLQARQRRAIRRAVTRLLRSREEPVSCVRS